MKKPGQTRLTGGLLLGLALLLFAFPGESAQGARQGVSLCAELILPSLFPFFVLSILLTSSLLGSRIPLLRPLGRLCGVPKGAESLLIPAFLAMIAVCAAAILIS